MKSAISIITLGVKNIARSKKFYQKLGFKPSSASQDDVVFFHTNGVVLALYPKHLLAKDAKLSSEASGFGGITLAHNVKKKQDVAKLLSEAEKAGAKILKPAQDVFWGGHSGYFADPDGYPWEVAWNPFFKFKRDGNLKLPR
jgi:predicted lactoylglutathione lyase